MTREEAMEILNNTAFFGRSQDDIDNAIDMAIEALKQAPCEDCISREKALELAENSHRLAETMEDLAWLHENNLKALPSVQPKPKQEPEPVYFPPCVDCQNRSKEILTAYNNMKKMQTYTKEEVISMLDKIRAEIEQITDTMGVSYNQYVSKIDVLQILDKYREREGKE